MVEVLKSQVPFSELPLPKEDVTIGEKITQSAQILLDHCDDEELRQIIGENGQGLREHSVLGLLPRVTPFDAPPAGMKLVPIPEALQIEQRRHRSYDLVQWNNPDLVLDRLEHKGESFEAPVAGNSLVMENANKERTTVSFADLRIESQPPKGKRKSRKMNYNSQETEIMGRRRIPVALGSVPDVGSALAYITMAQSHGLALVSRDKILSDPDNQAFLVETVIGHLKTVDLPSAILPDEIQLRRFWGIIGESEENFYLERASDLYIQELRESWIDNVGAAIETSPSALDRAKKLKKAGCNMFRIYSPEGGAEIIDTIKALRENPELNEDGKLKIIAGQIMDVETAQLAEEAGCDAIIIGVAGGSQCTTSVNADIPVNTPNLLYALRGKISVPIGIEGGGVGTHVPVALTLGASLVCKPGEVGRSFEGIGGKYIFEDENGDYWVTYGGEASDAAKWWRNSVDELGRPEFVEGASGMRKLDPANYYMTGNIHDLREQIAVALVFQRVDSIADLHKGDCSNITQMTPSSAGLSEAYATDKKV